MDAVRPTTTPCCGAVARPEGEGLNLHGHGVRSRGISGLFEMPDSWDALEAGGLASGDATILVRRFRCTVAGCETTMTVVPAEVRPCADTVGPTVVLALALWVIHPDNPSPKTIRRWLNPGWQTSTPGWPQLRRWASSIVIDVPDTTSPSTELPPKTRARELIRPLIGCAPARTRGDPLHIRVLAAAFEHGV